MKGILTIYLKEFKEVLRDRRTLIFMIVLPTIILPVLFNFMINFIAKQEKKASEETLEYALINGDLFPQLKQALADNPGFEIDSSIADEADIIPAIQNGDIKLGLLVPEDSSEYLDAGYPLEVKLVYNNASVTSKVVSRTNKLMDELNKGLRKTRLIEVGISNPLAQEGILEPSKVVKSGYASKREILGERIGGLLPYFFVVFCFMGAFYPAIDIGAGEKERGTLETLLLTPVPRSSLVLGKFGVVFTCAVVAAIVSLSSMGIWIYVQGSKLSGDIGEIVRSFSVVDLGLILLMILPTAALFAALMLSLSIFAKNFKEAQNFIAPLQFLLIFPAFMAFLPGISLNWKTALVPITNIALAVKELTKGTVDYPMVFMIFGSTAVLAGIATIFCVKWFQRESVLFRN